MSASTTQINSTELKNRISPFVKIGDEEKRLLLVRLSTNTDTNTDIFVTKDLAVLNGVLDNIRAVYLSNWRCTGLETILSPLINNTRLTTSDIFPVASMLPTSAIGYAKATKPVTPIADIVSGFGKEVKATFAAKILWDLINATVALGIYSIFCGKGATPFSWSNRDPLKPAAVLEPLSIIKASDQATAFVAKLNAQSNEALNITDELFDSIIRSSSAKLQGSNESSKSLYAGLHPANFEEFIANVAAAETLALQNSQISASDAVQTVDQSNVDNKSFFEKPAGMVSLAVGGIAIGLAISKLTSK